MKFSFVVVVEKMETQPLVRSIRVFDVLPVVSTISVVKLSKVSGV